MMTDNSTICAIATAAGTGAIAVIRLSGPDAITICDKVFTSPKKGKKLADQAPNTVHFGTIKDQDRLVDEVLVSLFKAPHSYTGEDSLEISCHGAPYIQQQILQTMIRNGARMAGPGEFTQRAFLNGKMDLSQAEAVADLIASSSEASHKMALNQMRGGFSDELIQVRSRLLEFISMVELELDFSEEEVEFADRNQFKELIHQIDTKLTTLIQSFNLGNVIKNGVPVAIVGPTNAGKSTLLNTILKEEKAIVSDIHGTTRDVIEDVINIKGYTFRFIDTAGIRTTVDKIESMGIDRTYRKIDQAKIVMLLSDIDEPLDKINTHIAEIRERLETTGQQLLIVLNKTDKLPVKDRQAKFSEARFLELTKGLPVIEIAAKYDKNIELLTNHLIDAVNLQQVSESDVIVSNTRHYQALFSAREAIRRADQGMDAGISGDFLSQDIRECMHYLGEITGEISNDEILGNIFANFCIGK